MRNEVISGIASGVIGSLQALQPSSDPVRETPASLTARTRKRWATPLRSPVTVVLVEPTRSGPTTFGPFLLILPNA